jgi:hypothetical protein
MKAETDIGFAYALPRRTEREELRVKESRFPMRACRHFLEVQAFAVFSLESFCVREQRFTAVRNILIAFGEPKRLLLVEIRRESCGWIGPGGLSHVLRPHFFADAVVALEKIAASAL